jgi:hypothetical protein
MSNLSSIQGHEDVRPLISMPEITELCRAITELYKEANNKVLVDSFLEYIMNPIMVIKGESK